MIPEKITIINNDGWTVIVDGKICDKLCWDEMLGTIAQLTLNGEIRYSTHTLGQDPYAWRKAPKQLHSADIAVSPKSMGTAVVTYEMTTGVREGGGVCEIGCVIGQDSPATIIGHMAKFWPGMKAISIAFFNSLGEKVAYWENCKSL